MIIGVPKEIKQQEHRVGLIPSTATTLTRKGHTVLVQKSAGLGSGYSDQDYIGAGAKMIDGAEEVFAKADMIVKVKEPLKAEWGLLRKGQILFTYLHLAASKELTEALVKSGVTGVAYETIQIRHRTWQNLSQMPPHYLVELATPPPVTTPSIGSSVSTITAGAASQQHTTGGGTNKGLSVKADAPRSQQNAEWLTKFKSSEKEVKDLKTDESRPKLCLSYHLRGTCFEACREHATHRALTTAEKKVMQDFLDKAL